MKKRMITTQTTKGIYRVKAFVRKNLAINKNRGWWVVTHVPSGRRFPGWYSTKKEAIKASKITRSAKITTQENYLLVLRESGINFSIGLFSDE